MKTFKLQNVILQTKILLDKFKYRMTEEGARALEDE